MSACLDCGEAAGGRHGLCEPCASERIDQVRASLSEDRETLTELQSTLGSWGA